MWDGPLPAFHALPYSWAHCHQGSRHHFAEVVASTKIVARELRYHSAVQYVSQSTRMDLLQRSETTLLTDK
jgi:hypothetical protein